MSASLNLAVAQSPGELTGAAARLAWLRDLLAGQEVRPLDLLVLPELFQCGYNIGEGLSDAVQPPDGPFAKAVAELAHRHGLAILYGYAERQGEHLFNSAICFDAAGQVVGHHRKLLLPPGFEGDHFEPGAECTVFELNGVQIAILVCYDVEFPENLRHVAMQGAHLVVVPTALGAQWGVVSQRVVPTRAFENGVYVAYANHCGRENGLDYFGGSCIAAPDGSDLARAGEDPGLICALIETETVGRAQSRLPYHKDRKNLPWVG
ncbi:carbon-nitrogen hydrolase family protein [Rhodobacteraceae bacterium M382]|nr:carbon-nitrogen hydrolase family protein [Rhodobacteraceae bacterium M382]